MRSREASPAVVPSANPTLSLKSLSNVPQFIVPPFRFRIHSSACLRSETTFLRTDSSINQPRHQSYCNVLDQSFVESDIQIAISDSNNNNASILIFFFLSQSKQILRDYTKIGNIFLNNFTQKKKNYFIELITNSFFFFLQFCV